MNKLAKIHLISCLQAPPIFILTLTRLHGFSRKSDSPELFSVCLLGMSEMELGVKT